jgi:uncharacterized protein (DUF1501 family)
VFGKLSSRFHFNYLVASPIERYKSAVQGDVERGEGGRFMNRKPTLSRRSVLRIGAQTAIAGLGAMSATASATATDGRVLICLYLGGGNDGNNSVIPLAQYADYARARGELAIARGCLLEARGLGFHPALSEMRTLYEEGVLSVVANVGTLAAPLRGDPRAAVPGSHLDPEMAYLPGGFLAPRFAARASGPSNAITGFRPPGSDSDSSVVMFTHGRRVAAGLRDRHLARARATATPAFPPTSIGKQLRQVAGSLAAAAESGLGRQVYLVHASGFDTHRRQLSRQHQALRQLSHALGALRAALVTMGISDRVLVVTDSEFSRALAPNGRGGADHGWGGPQFVMGGGLAGGRVFGRFPIYQFGGPQDATGKGVWIPDISRVQYAATLAHWIGDGLDEVAQSLPEVRSFARPVIDLAA